MAALKEHYRNLAANEKKLGRADFIGFTVIPTLASCFIAGYWILGMMKYYSPDWSAYQDLVPEFQVNLRISQLLEYRSLNISHNVPQEI